MLNLSVQIPGVFQQSIIFPNKCAEKMYILTCEYKGILKDQAENSILFNVMPHGIQQQAALKCNYFFINSKPFILFC